MKLMLQLWAIPGTTIKETCDELCRLSTMLDVIAECQHTGVERPIYAHPGIASEDLLKALHKLKRIK